MTATARLASLPVPVIRQPNLTVVRQQRAALKLLWMTSPETREQIRLRCAGDQSDIKSMVSGFIFWANHFCFAHNEFKPPRERILPVELWELQEEIAEVAIENIMRCALDPNEEWNAYGDKGRMMAWTFLWLLIIQWFWQFHGISTVITSKTLDDVDRIGDMNTPFEKLRWQIELQFKQAPWLFPVGFDINNEKCFKQLLIANPGARAQIAGLAPSGKAMRQARALIAFMDELPHTDTDYELYDAACGTVKVRIGGGTPNIQRGKNCKAYKLRYNIDNENAHIFAMDWWRNPERAIGLYRKPDGSLSSPWFDGQCQKKSKQAIAAEFLMDWNIAMGAQVLYMFREESRVFNLQPDPGGGPIFCSWDPGKCYGVKWGQEDRYGRLLDLYELVLTEEDVQEAGKTLLRAVAERVIKINNVKFKGHQIIHVGDPYGSRTQVSFQTETEYEMLFKQFGIRVISAYMYAIAAEERKKKRHEVLGDLMGTDIILPDGKVTPRYLLNASCTKTYEAIKTGYRWAVDPKTKEKTDKIVKSHPDTEMIDTIGMIAVKVFHTTYNHANPAGTGKPKVSKRPIQWRRSGAR
jgi:hypothetical protein